MNGTVAPSARNARTARTWFGWSLISRAILATGIGLSDMGKKSPTINGEQDLVDKPELRGPLFSLSSRVRQIGGGSPIVTAVNPVLHETVTLNRRPQRTQRR